MPNTTLTRLLYEQGGLCFFCEKALLVTEASVEHLVARANGGRDQNDNCVACCKSLNLLLGSKSVKEKMRVVLNQKGQFECPNGVQRKTKRQASKAVKSVPVRYAQVVENLKQRKGKPRTVPKLENLIAALFPKEISKDEVDALIQQLQSRRVISINGSKLTYA